jgi:hypothetical protein
MTKRWMGLLTIALMGLGCTMEGIEEGDEFQESAANADEDIAEVSQAVVIGSYSASNTSFTKFPVDLDGGETVMIGTGGLKGASYQGDTFLKLAAPTGDFIPNLNPGNDNYTCNGSTNGSRFVYTSSFNFLKTFTLWAGCNGSTSCSGTTVVSRRKGHFQYSATNTNHGNQGTTNRDYWMVAGRWIRVSTCSVDAATAAHTGDTFLRLYRKDGANTFEVKSNDDSLHCSANCDVGSTILYQVPSDGYYQVRAGCYGNTACSGTVAVYAE